MGIKNQDGFTIIEISLFFAVSGLLLVTMLSGVGVSIQRQRFTDSVNGTQAFLQQQYQETQVTLNDRDTSDCGPLSRGASECLVVGKLIDLGKGDANAEEVTLHSYEVIVNQNAADAAVNTDSPPGDRDFLNNDDGDGVDAKTKAIKSTRSDQDYIVPWGAKLDTLEDSKGNPGPSNSSDLRYILIARSPINGLISTYKLNISRDIELFDSTNSYSIVGTIKDFEGTENQSIKACVASADLFSTKALLKITPGSSQDSVTTQFDTDEKGNWCS
ncbi:MAG: hypothetical protein Q7T74_02540 [Candidatus Saccharibacteria bacterium]|nr:hypothetical protein [Candidatus Saccharibacteria bacterium]